MKLRIRGNSVRVRLTRSEVARLGDGKLVDQTTQFSSTSTLRSAVVPSDRTSAPRVAFDDGCLTVHLPQDDARRWAASDDVTLAAQQQIEPGRQLQILVEKDFQCIHSRKEENDDAFPNPREQHPELSKCQLD